MVREEGVRSGVVDVPTFFINSLQHESAFGLATLLPAVQAAAGGSRSGEPQPERRLRKRASTTDASRRCGTSSITTTASCSSA